jgi:hypothetical protein
MIARDACCVFDGGGVVSIDVEEPRAGDLPLADLSRRDREAVRPSPEHSSFPGGFIDDDVRGLIRAVRSLLDVLNIDAGMPQALHLNAAAFIVTNRADIFRAEAKPGAGDHGRGNLAPNRDEFPREWNLASISGKARDDQHCVGCVEPNADDVEFA